MNNIKNTTVDFFNGFQKFAQYMKAIDNKIRIAVKDFDSICKEFIPVFFEFANTLYDSLKEVVDARDKMVSKGFIAGDHLFSLTEIVELDQSSDDYDEAIYLKSIESKIIDEILLLISKSNILDKRYHLIAEGLQLHTNKLFAGSVTLLLSQIEGLFDDYLVLNHCAYYDKKGNLNIEKEVLSGIAKKLDKINSIALDQKDIVESLISEAFIDNNKPKGFNKIRNGILHGSNVNFNTKATSTQIVLWLYVIVSNFYLKPVKNNER